ncbi:MAG: peptidylprolyl isomerase [Hyphomicrobiaceae bacterium]
MRVSHIALALALIGAFPAILPAPVKAEDKVVATIDGKPITEADLAVADSEIGGDMGSMPEDQKRMSLLEFLIDNQLFAEAAEANKLDQGPAFESRLAYLKRRALRELYFDKVIKGSVSDEEARKLYDEQVKKLKPEEEARASHILVETEAEAKDIKEKLKNGGDFAALAKEHSKDPGSKDNGGDLGFFTRGQMVPQFEEVVFSMNKGDISDPVQTQFGWHLIKLDDKRAKAPPAFEVVKDRILQSMLLQKASRTAIDLRSKAKIEYVDEGIKKTMEDRIKAAQGSAAPAASETKPADKPEEKTEEKPEEKK